MIYNMTPKNIDKGIFGINIHRSNKTCICDMYANDVYSINMTKDSNGHWTQKVDYCLRDVCVKKGLSMEVGDIGDMSGYVHWIAFA